MDLLAGYGSDEEARADAEDSSSIALESARSGGPVTRPQQASSSSSGARRRKLDLSILPQHIQDLLTKGAVADSDSDDDYQPSAAPAPPRREGGSSLGAGLLSMLPEPSSDVVSEGRGPREHSNVRPPAAVSVSQIAVVSAPIAIAAEHLVDSDSDSDTETSPPRVVSTHPPQVPAAATASYSAVSTTATELPAFQLLSRKSAAPAVQEFSAFSHSQSVPQNRVLSDASVANAVVYADPSADSSDRKRSRRQDREIELSLLGGDLSKLENAKFVEVRGVQPWNSSAYEERQQRGDAPLIQYSYITRFLCVSSLFLLYVLQKPK